MGFYTTDECTDVLESCQENLTPPSKNRVWNFFTTSETCTGFFESQPVESHQEKWPTPTKPVSGVRYYGYRYYMPEIGRWSSRDPIGDEGFLRGYVDGMPWKQQKKYREASLKPTYVLVANASVNKMDSLGLLTANPGNGQVHGNWCGGGWTAGGPLDAKDYDWENDPRPAVIDKLDACCRKHDACYANWDLDKAAPKTGSPDTDACDADLCGCARRSDVGGGPANQAIQCWMCRNVDRAKPDSDKKCCLLLQFNF